VPNIKPPSANSKGIRKRPLDWHFW